MKHPPEYIKLLYWQIACGVCALLALGAVLYAYAFSGRNGGVEEFAAEYPYIDLARNFIPQEHFIIDIQPLRERLRAIEERTRERYEISLYFEFLNTGANISINPDAQVWPASLLKVPAALAVMKKVENGDWQLDSELVITNGDKDAGFGELWEQPIGSRYTVEELLRAMLIDSDNTAYNMFLRNLPKDDLLEALTELGVDDLFTSEGKISAKEYSRLLRALYTSSFLKRENSQLLIEMLTESDFNRFLAQGIPNEVTFAHKFGIREDAHAYLDSGIAYPPNRPYLITVAIRDRDEGTDVSEEIGGVQELMEEISRAAYEYVSEK